MSSLAGKKSTLLIYNHNNNHKLFNSCNEANSYYSFHFISIINIVINIVNIYLVFVINSEVLCVEKYLVII